MYKINNFFLKIGNNLGDASINKFLLSLQYQKTLMEMHKSPGTGLLRLILTVKFLVNAW